MANHDHKLGRRFCRGKVGERTDYPAAVMFIEEEVGSQGQVKNRGILFLSPEKFDRFLLLFNAV